MRYLQDKLPLDLMSKKVLTSPLLGYSDASHDVPDGIDRVKGR